jgi:RHS repeat-associated protein
MGFAGHASVRALRGCATRSPKGESGLHLTQYRVYDPIAGRWLSRDPLGEQSDVVANLYRYVGGNPVSFRDISGLAENPCDEGNIFRKGDPNPGNLTPRPGENGLSFRNSLSNPKEGQPVFPPGSRYIEVDPSKLPPGSVIRDDNPPGHVTVLPLPVDVLQGAVVGRGRFPK